MKEEYMGFRVGDRLRMVSCTDPYAPILPGQKGTIDHIDDIGTLHMTWDNGRTLGVVVGEDEVEKVPLDEELDRVGSKSAIECADEASFEEHREKALEAVSLMEEAALDSGGAWAVRITHLDVANRGRMPEFAFVEADGLGGLLDGADAKNGGDASFHEAGRHRSFVMVAHGAGYNSPSGSAHAQEAFECRLLKPKVADDYRARMNAGWSDRGEGPRAMFFSRGDQQPLSAERRKLLDQSKDRPKGMDR